MARFNDLGEGKLEGRKLDPRTIIVRSGFNFRQMDRPEVKAHIAWLKGEIKTNGVQEAIRVEYSDGKAYLVNGQCRVEACRQLWEEGVKVPYKSGGEGPPLVPAIVIQGDEAEILAASMRANGGLPPTVLEFGSGADRLMKLGWPVDKVAALTPPHLGLIGQRAEQYVKQAVELQHAPMAVKEAVAHGVDGVAVSPALAVQATRTSREKAPEIIREAVTKAKAAGKKEAKRPKGDGKVGKAKKAEEKKVRSLVEIGDAMAKEALRAPCDLEKLEDLAKEWQMARIR